MSGNKLWCFGMVLFLGSFALPAPGQEVKDLGAHRFGSLADFQNVIDAKCTICHTRERVDRAIQDRKNLQRIERKMVSEGARLTPRDKEVLGAFWGNPLKGR